MTTTRAIQRPDLAAARRVLYARRDQHEDERLARAQRIRDGSHVPGGAISPALSRAAIVIRARRHRAELARWRALGTPPDVCEVAA